MKNNYKYSAMLVAVSSVLAALSAKAANTFYAPGDLVLFFQQQGGANTVYANLGAATGFRGTASGASDGTNSINFLNLNTTLTSAFGTGWASDPTVYAGLAGNFSNSGTSLTVTDGDPALTLYVSASRDNVGTVGQASSAGYTVVTNTGMATAGSAMLNQHSAFENNYDSLVTISPTGTSTIDENNTFLGESIQGPAFGIFGSGVQQAGDAGSFGPIGEAGKDFPDKSPAQEPFVKAPMKAPSP
jgi:hypothetical protein